jgi:hypothetical protein
MKMRTLFIINAVIQLFFGLGFMLAPTIVLGLFGTQTDATGITLAHVAGGVILSLAIISWLGRDIDTDRAQDAIAWGAVFFAHFQAGILTLFAILNGIFNTLAWSAVVMDAFFVVAFFLVRGQALKKN